MKDKSISVRLLLILVGISIMALGTAACRNTAFGIDPFNAFCVGLGTTMHLASGTVTLVMQVVLAVVVLMVHRQYLGLGTLIPVVIFGYLLQFFSGVLPNLTSVSLSVRMLVFLLGIVVTTFGMAIYMTCELGMVPYDCLSFLVSPTRPFATRIVIDVTVAVLAFLLGGPISVGTLVFAFGTGPLIGWFKEHLVLPAFQRFVLVRRG